MDPSNDSAVAIAPDLGPTLRAWRARLLPEDVGLDLGVAAGIDLGGPRRVPGLRRKELARLAGVSPDYVRQLEQGGASTPSAQVLSALATALRLSDAERTHLFRLGGQLEPADGVVAEELPPDVQRLVDVLHDSPVAVYNARWTLIAWNPLWVAVHGDPEGLPEIERNIAWRQFTGLPTRVVRTPEENAAYEEMLVADLRASAARYVRDSKLATLVNDLSAASERFRALWQSRSVSVYESEVKTVDHPTLGRVRIECHVLATRGSDMRVTIYRADPDSDSSQKLDTLRSHTRQP
jgi:transcriptional regulator with XRE-family HTH domain